jgi:hypothetical protein
MISFLSSLNFFSSPSLLSHLYLLFLLLLLSFGAIEILNAYMTLTSID